MPKAGLGAALAVASSCREMPIAGETARAGEVGLRGEIKPVSRLGRRVAELHRQGFRRWPVSRQAEAQTVAKIEATPAG